MTDTGYKKVGKKARHGRKRNPEPHGSHRNSAKGVVSDPISRAFKRIHREVLAKKRQPRFGDDEAWS